MRRALRPGLAVLLAGGIVGGAALWAGRRRRRPGESVGSEPPPGVPRVLILGAGFGGITTAVKLGRMADQAPAIDVTLVDRANAHLFTPMLYQVATGLLEPGNIVYPARAIARDFGFRFRQGEIQAIDLDDRSVLVDGDRIGYDRLVIALGSVTNYFGNASIERCAASLKSLADAVAIRNRVLDAFERADRERDAAARQALLTFAIVGGGATGVELAGSLYTLIHAGLLPTYPALDPREVRVLLVEAGPSLLNGMDPWLGEAAARRIRAKGIELLLGNPAVEVRADGITFRDGQVVASRTVVWAAGVRPSPLTAALPVERGRDGRLVVDQYLRLPAHPEVFVLGDCAWFPLVDQDGRPAPPNAQTAVRQAPVVAQNVVSSLRPEPLTAFRYANAGHLVALGQGDGVALIGTRRLEGFPAWATWRGYYLTQLMGFKNRLAVLVEWAAAYAGHRATARLDVGPGAAAGSMSAADDASAPAAAAPAPPAPGPATGTDRSSSSSPPADGRVTTSPVVAVSPDEAGASARPPGRSARPARRTAAPGASDGAAPARSAAADAEAGAPAGPAEAGATGAGAAESRPGRRRARRRPSSPPESGG